MNVYLQVDNGVVTGVLRSSFPEPPSENLPPGRSFVVVPEALHYRDDSHWMGMEIVELKKEVKKVVKK